MMSRRHLPAAFSIAKINREKLRFFYPAALDDCIHFSQDNKEKKNRRAVDEKSMDLHDAHP